MKLLDSFIFTDFPFTACGPMLYSFIMLVIPYVSNNDEKIVKLT